jgi:hypothetical protein
LLLFSNMAWLQRCWISLDLFCYFLLFFFFWWWRRRRQQQQKNPDQVASTTRTSRLNHPIIYRMYVPSPRLTPPKKKKMWTLSSSRG